MQRVDFVITSEDDGGGGAGSHSGNMVRRTLEGVHMSLLGAHQRDNARTALAVMEFLRRGGGQGADDCDGGEGWAVSDDDMRRGLEAAESPGCFETVVAPASPAGGSGGGGGGDGDVHSGVQHFERPVPGGGGSLGCAVVADGAHTKESAAAAMATLSEVFPGQPLAVVVAMASDKDHQGFLREVMAVRPVSVVLTQVPIAGGRERATPVEALMVAWNAAAAAADEVAAAASGERSGVGGEGSSTAAATPEKQAPWTTTVSVVHDLGEAITLAAAAVRRGGGSGNEGGGVVCVTGSLNTVSKARAWAGERGYS